MNRLFLFSFVFLFLSCTSILKDKDEADGFSADSDFLKQGHKIESYPNSYPEEEVKSVEIKKYDLQEPARLEKSKKERKHKSQKKKSLVLSEKKPVKKPQKEASKDKVKHETKALPFRVGEEVTLSATYFGVEAGKILIGVDSFKKFEGKKQYHFYAFGKTSSLFSMFYKVKNKIESLWDPEIQKPRTLAFDVTETKQKYKIRVYFDWLKKVGEYLEEGWEKKKGDYQVKKNWKLPNHTQDVLSAIFYTRTLPLEVEEEYKVSVMEEDKLIDVYFQVDRKELLRTRIGKLKTLVLKPRFFTEGKFKQVGDISVWLTDDSYRQVVRIESKIKIGTIIAKLHSMKRPK